MMQGRRLRSAPALVRSLLDKAQQQASIQLSHMKQVDKQRILTLVLPRGSAAEL